MCMLGRLGYYKGFNGELDKIRRFALEFCPDVFFYGKDALDGDKSLLAQKVKDSNLPEEEKNAILDALR